MVLRSYQANDASLGLRSGERAQIAAEPIGMRATEKMLQPRMRALPNRNRAGQQCPTADVSLSLRLRLSTRSAVTSTKPRRSKGFRAAVSVVRSIASSAATEPMLGGSGRFSDIISEN